MTQTCQHIIKSIKINIVKLTLCQQITLKMYNKSNSLNATSYAKQSSDLPTVPYDCLILTFKLLTKSIATLQVTVDKVVHNVVFQTDPLKAGALNIF